MTDNEAQALVGTEVHGWTITAATRSRPGPTNDHQDSRSFVVERAEASGATVSTSFSESMVLAALDSK